LKNKKEITCIICPIGCKILVEIEGKKLKIVNGNKCNQGITYAKSEALDPRRMLTSSVLVKNGNWPLVSVKSSQAIPKEKVFDVLNEIKKTIVEAPIYTGSVLIENVQNTKIDIIATKKINEKMEK